MATPTLNTTTSTTSSSDDGKNNSTVTNAPANFEVPNLGATTGSDDFQTEVERIQALAKEINKNLNVDILKTSRKPKKILPPAAPEAPKKSFKDEILAALPKVELDPTVLQTIEGDHVERTEAEVAAEEVEVIEDHEEEKKEMESAKEDVSTLAGLAQKQQLAAVKSDAVMAVEDILEDGLDEYYMKMSPEEKMEFKAEGELVASQITKLLRAAKVKVVKIVELIVNWLRRIPGVNKYYLEKESKIKTDELLQIKKDKEGLFDK